MDDKKTNGFNLAELRKKLEGKSGPQYWRSLEEVAETEEFQLWMEDEFPHRKTLLEMDRRSMLKFMGASMALAGLSGCRSAFMPQDKVVPYVKQPEDLVPGKPLFYATGLTLGGYATGALVEQHEGRPTKVEGNPEHPASLGASTSWMQASVLSLYDPERARNIQEDGNVSTWNQLIRTLRKELASQKSKRGAGIRILTETVTSPTLTRQIRELQARYPEAQWHAYEPGHADAVYEGTRIAFGKPAWPLYNFQKAKRIVSLDFDFLQDGPGALVYARQFADGRRVLGVPESDESINRLYVYESTPTLAGSMADHRFRVRPSAIPGVAEQLLSAVAGQSSDPTVAAIARDLLAHRGESLVVVGDHLPAEVHATVHAINQAIGAFGTTVQWLDWLETSSGNHLDSIANLVTALNSNSVDLLLVLGGNPVYDAPANLGFAEAIAKAKVKVRYSLYDDETAKRCDWTIPATHELEHWSDARAVDGTITLTQPLTAPLFNAKSIHELFAAMLESPKAGFDILRDTHKNAFPAASFEKLLRKALNDGWIPNSKAIPISVTASGSTALRSQPGTGLELRFQLDPCTYDGRFANNGWLMELPRPLTKVVWDNVALMSPATAESLGVQNEDTLEIQFQGATVSPVPAWIHPGMPDDVITVQLGFGRTEGGTVAKDQGFNAYTMRTVDAPWFGTGVEVRKLGGKTRVASTQHHHQILDRREVIRWGTLDRFREDVAAGKPALEPEGAIVVDPDGDPEDYPYGKSLYPGNVFEHEGPQWGMTIDMNVCVGCNACVTACQAENNIPVVGKTQVQRGRELHWIRIDRYYVGGLDDPSETVFQPMMCVQCEKAPCEPVCPVGATVHSHEGLNQMVYNRCVGTRYCSNNCPYKVRRFNFLNYSDNQPNYSDKVQPWDDAVIPGPINTPKQDGIQLLKMINNPDVTVRGRGVMEKCTYCVQRINEARIEGKKQGRDPIDGEIVTACEQACPTQAIVFGNLMDETSRVSKMRRDPRSYLLLAELQTRPRTSYLGKLSNPNPELAV
jgi:molybdopterin-containing oxidoreductase family iron-sulfur binding subunit